MKDERKMFLIQTCVSAPKPVIISDLMVIGDSPGQAGVKMLYDLLLEGLQSEP